MGASELNTDQCEPQKNIEENHYARHLAIINESSEVCTSEDIVSSTGVLLCRKGTRITNGLADNIVQHKLVKPLEEQIIIADSLNGQALFGMCEGLMEKYPDLGKIHASQKFKAECKELFIGRALHPTLIQKFTVLKQQRPKDLDKGIFAGWLAALIAREMDLDKENIYAAFIAGLTHDIGFIHLDPDMLSKSGEFTPEEWRALQSHAVIGQKILEGIPDIPPQSARAVLEHHERCDGSGYPAGKTDAKLTVLGQIVGIADSIQAIRINQFEKCGRNLRDLLPYLQMNSKTHFYEVYEATSAILRVSGLKPTVLPLDGDVASFAHALHDRCKALKDAVEILMQRQILALAQRIEEGRGGDAMFKVTDHILMMTAQSGLLSEDLFSWLTGLEIALDESQETLNELYEIELMINELHWQLNNAIRVFKVFYEQECEKDSDEHNNLKGITDDLRVCMQKCKR